MKNEALYDRGLDRFREPGEFSKAAASDEEALGCRLQAVHGNSSSMAKSSQYSSSGGQLSASNRGRPNRQGSVCCGQPSYTTEGKKQLGRSVVRQFFAADAGGRAFHRPGNET